MLNLKSLILLVLISFSLQDNNCAVYFERCLATISIDNCIDGHSYTNENNEKIEYCSECKAGYLNSYDGKKCIYMENPIQYCIDHFFDSNDQLKCSKCDKSYSLSYDQKSCTSLPKEIKNCISYYLDNEGTLLCNECKTDYFPSYDKESCIEFKNCDSFNNNEENEYCDYCNDGYALSYDNKNCTAFENCEKLAYGDKKCDECVELYHPNAEGKCERTQCKDYNDDDVCTECYDGYYLDEKKNCKKITIELCLKSDSKGEKCTECSYEITPDANGKCNLPTQLIKGCIQYGSDGKCSKCKDEGVDYKLTDGTCKFIDCKDGGHKVEYCYECKPGYFEAEDENDNDYCMGYDGSRDTSSDTSSRIQVEYALLIFILALLI